MQMTQKRLQFVRTWNGLFQPTFRAESELQFGLGLSRPRRYDFRDDGMIIIDIYDAAQLLDRILAAK
jgi:hypothetical protein